MAQNKWTDIIVGKTTTQIVETGSTEAVNDLSKISDKLDSSATALKQIIDKANDSGATVNDQLQTLVSAIQQQLSTLKADQSNLQSITDKSKLDFSSITTEFENLRAELQSLSAFASQGNDYFGIADNNKEYTQAIANLQDAVKTSESASDHFQDVVTQLEQLRTQTQTLSQEAGNAAKEASKTTKLYGQQAQESADNIKKSGTKVSDMLAELATELLEASASKSNTVDAVKELSNRVEQLGTTQIIQQVQHLEQLLSSKNGSFSQITPQAIQFVQQTANSLKRGIGIIAQTGNAESTSIFSQAAHNIIAEAQQAINSLGGKALVASNGDEKIQATVFSNKETIQRTLENLEATISLNAQKVVNQTIQTDTEMFNSINGEMGKLGTPTVRDKSDFAVASDNIGRINLSSTTSQIMNAIETIDLQHDRQQNTFYYNYIKGGKLFGDRNQLRDNLLEVHKFNSLSSTSLPTYTDAFYSAMRSNDRSGALAALNGMNVPVNKEAEAIKRTAEGMNLSKLYGAKELSESDKKILENFKSAVSSSINNINNLIRATQELDPNDKSIEELKSQSKQLNIIKGQIQTIQNKSSVMSGTFNLQRTGLRSFRNMMMGGLGIFGLGRLMQPLVMARNGINMQINEGKQRYNLARTAYYMGANPNQDLIMEFARFMPDKFYRLSQGNIGFNEVPQYFNEMAHNVGSHYGSTPNEGMNDMAKITEDTFAISKVYNISSSEAANFMKTFYKDLGMSADAASSTLVSLAQTANSSSVPVNKYVSIITSMANSLRNTGLDGRDVAAQMKGLMASGLRVEDAQDLVKGQNNAERSMANDYNSAAFFGMWSGQGSNPFQNIVNAQMTHNADGTPNRNWHTYAGADVLSEAQFNVAIAGGIGTQFGQFRAMQTFERRGFSEKDSSMLVDAWAHGDMSLFNSLMAKAEKNKDGGKQELIEQINNATNMLKEAGNQVSVFSKAQTSLVMAEKHLGESLENNLTKPMSYFEKGFRTALSTIVDTIDALSKRLSNFLNTSTGQHMENFVANHPFLAIGGTMLAVGAAKTLTPKAGIALVKRAFSSPSVTRTVAEESAPEAGKMAQLFAKFSRFGGRALPIAGLVAGTAAVVGGAYMLYKVFTSIPTFRVTKDNSEVSHDLNDLQNIQQQIKNDENNNNNNHSNPSDTIDYSKYTQNSNEDIDNDDTTSSAHFSSNIGYDETSARADYNHNIQVARQLASQQQSVPQITDAQSLQKLASLQQQINGQENEQQPKHSMALSAVNMAASALPAFGMTSKFFGYDKNSMDTMRNLSKETSLAEKAKLSPKMLGLGLKGIGRSSAITTLIADTIGEGIDAYEGNTDFTTAQRAERVGIDTATTTAGMVIGGTLGSILPGAGTTIGAVAGGYLGSLAGDYIKDKMGLSREKHLINNAGDKVASSGKENADKYSDGTKKLIESNNDRKRAAELALKNHGDTLTNLTENQQRYMDNIFSQLKSMGLGDKVAAFLSGQAVETQKQQAVKQFEVDDDTKIKTYQYLEQKYEKAGDYDKAATYQIAIDYLQNKDDPSKYNGSSKLQQVYEQDRFDYDDTKNDYSLEMWGKLTDDQKLQAIREKEKDDSITMMDMKIGERFSGKYEEDFSPTNGQPNSGYNYLQNMKHIAESANTQTSDKDKQDADAFYRNSSPSTINTDTNGELAVNGIEPPTVTNSENINDQPAVQAIDERAKIANTALSKNGDRYVYGAAGPDEFDCSGLIYYSFKQNGLNIARTADAQYDEIKRLGGIHHNDGYNIKPGDLIFLRGSDPGANGVGHVEMYVGNGKTIQAGSSRTGVHMGTFNPAKDTYVGIGDISKLGVTGEGSSIGSAEALTGGLSNERATTPEEAISQSIASRTNLIKQMAQLNGGLSDEEFAKDSVASGQLIIDGTSALSSNGNFISIGGARRMFREHSGYHPQDMYGYGIQGAFTVDKNGKATYTKGAGIVDLRKNMEKFLPKPTKPTWFGEAKDSLSAGDKLMEEADKANRENHRVYEHSKEVQKDLEEQHKDTASSKKDVEINITALSNNNATVQKVAQAHRKNEVDKANLSQRISWVEKSVQQIVKNLNYLTSRGLHN